MDGQPEAQLGRERHGESRQSPRRRFLQALAGLDRDFGVFSESFHTNPRPFGQTYPFGVRWIQRAPGNHSILWFSVPSLDKAGYQRVSHPHGFHLDAQTTFQHGGNILFVVDTEPKGKQVEYPYGLCFVPGSVLAMTDESRQTGRIFLHYPGVLLAISATKTFSWDRSAPIRMPNYHDKPAPDHSEFRIEGTRFVAAIETAPARNYAGVSPEEQLAAFHRAVTTTSRVETVDGESLTGRYTDRNGVVIQRAFAGPASINGIPVDFDHWPLASSPWVNQRTQEDPLVVSDGSHTRTYDFHSWQVIDRGASAAH